MNDQKIRIRSEEELDLQGQGLKEVANILKSQNIDYFLSTGTLLGAVRDGDFIKWDWDIGIYLKTEEVFPLKCQLINLFINSGFELSSLDFTPFNFKINIQKAGAEYELMGLGLYGKYRLRKHGKIPAYFFEEKSTVTLRGKTYDTFGEKESYLKYVYGDWRTPLRSSNKKKYLKGQFYKRTLRQWVRGKIIHILKIIDRPSAL